MGDMADYYKEVAELDMWKQFNKAGQRAVPERLSFQWWVQKNGSKIHITKMTDSHINNCIAIIDRNEWREQWREPLLNELKRRNYG